MLYEPGQFVGDYQVVERLGAGGMGAVYKVRNVITDRLEAMKVLLADLRATPELAERFSREIRVHASLVHPNIAGLHTAIRVDQQLLMIMELVEGESLAERLRRGPVAPAEAAGYACQVLSALGFAHERGVVHRDIKPANIMLTPSGTVKLMDFGIAATKGNLHHRLTAAGMALGSVHYMSPEQVRAGAPDARSDLYSLGVTFYETVTGVCPIRGASEYEIMNAHLTAVPPSPSELNPAVPPVLSAIILMAIEKRPESRFQTAGEFRAALEPLTSAVLPHHLPLPARTAFVPQQRTGSAPALTPVPTPSSPLPTPSNSPHPPDPGPLDPGTLEAASRELAAYIGPIARIIVNRAARQVQTRRQLYESVGQEISNPAERARFLAKYPK
jgi:eukaryotic-like serine/threonine-protein kinase